MSMTSRRKYSYVKTEIYDDQGFLFGEKLRKSYAELERVSYSFSERDPSLINCYAEEPVNYMACAPYFLIEMMTTRKLVKVTRQYKGLVETLSDLGGIVDILFLLCFWLYSFYNARAVRDKIVELIYKVKRPSATSSCGCRKKRKVAQETSDSSGSTTIQQTASKEDRDRRAAAEYKRLQEHGMKSIDICEIAIGVSGFKVLSHFLFSEEVRKNASLLNYHLETSTNKSPSGTALPQEDPARMSESPKDLHPEESVSKLPSKTEQLQKSRLLKFKKVPGNNPQESDPIRVASKVELNSPRPERGQLGPSPSDSDYPVLTSLRQELSDLCRARLEQLLNNQPTVFAQNIFASP